MCILCTTHMYICIVYTYSLYTQAYRAGELDRKKPDDPRSDEGISPSTISCSTPMSNKSPGSIFSALLRRFALYRLMQPRHGFTSHPWLWRVNCKCG